MCCLPALTTRRPACASGCSDYPSPSHTYCRPPSGRNPWGTGTWLARLGHPRTTRCDPQLRRRTWHSPCTAHRAEAAACAPCTLHHSRAHSPSAHTCLALAPRTHAAACHTQADSGTQATHLPAIVVTGQRLVRWSSLSTRGRFRS